MEKFFVHKIPSINIMDLAKAVCPGCKTEIVGIRPGEKLHEVMITRDDARNTVEFNDYYVIKSTFRYFKRRFSEEDCKPVNEDFEYNSETNPWQLSIDELKKMIKNL